MAESRVGITGVTGFLGWHLAQAFRAAGWHVTGFVRPGSPRALPEGVTRVETALEPAALSRASAALSVMVHAAGLTSGAAANLDAVNVSGTQAAVAAANAAGARLVFISSQAAAGAGTADRPARDDDEPRPVNAYGRSKLAAEGVIAASARVPWIVLRPASVYGPRDRQFLPLFRLAARGWFPMITSPAMTLTLLHVEDLARAVVLAANSDVAGTSMFLGHPRPTSVEELLVQLSRVVGRPYRPRRVPGPLLSVLSMAGDAARLAGGSALLHRDRLVELRAEGFVCATDKAQAALGFEAATELPEGLERTWEWYREHGWV